MTIEEIKDTLQTWIRTADDEFDREEMGRVYGLKSALRLIEKLDVTDTNAGDLISRQAAKSKAVYSLERHEKVVPVAELDWLLSVEPEKCSDCISRKVATDRFDLVQSDDKCMSYDDILAFLSSLPSVEPERKPGKWLSTIHHCKRWMVCSQCGSEHIYDRYTAWNYCPNCGAKMMEVDK